MGVTERRWLPGDRMAALVLLLVVVVYLGEAAMMRGAFFVGDVACQNFPIQCHFSSEVRSGRLPLWTPQLFCGFPLHAEGQGGLFYPLNLLFYVRPATIGLNLFIILHTFLAGLFVYWLARTMSLGAWGALLSGMAYSLSSLVNRHHGILNHFSALVWLPVPLAMLNLWIRDRRHIWALLGGLVLGVQWLAGHPQFSWMTHLALGLLLMFHWWSPKLPHWRDRLRALGVVATMAVIGLGLAMVQLLPLRELARFSERSQGMRYRPILESGLAARAYLDLISPGYFGKVEDLTALDDLDQVAILYVGIAPLLLAPFAFRGDRRRWSLGLVILAAVGVLLSFERFELASRLIAMLPPASFFRYRMRYIVFLVLALVLLAGRGLGALLDLHPARSAAYARSRSLWPWVAGLVLLGVGASWLLFLAREGWLPESDQGPLADATLLFQDKLEAIRGARAGDLIRLVLFWGAAVVTLILYGVRVFPRRAFAAVVVGQLAINGLLFGVERPPLINMDYYTDTPETLDLLKDQNELFRVYGAGDYPFNPYGYDGFISRTNDLQEAYGYYPELISSDMSLLYGVDSAGGFPHSLRLNRFIKAERYLFTSGDVRILRLMNVKYVFSVRVLTLAGLELIHSGRVQGYRVKQFLPRAFVVYDLVRATGETDAFAKLIAPGLDPGRTAVVEGEDDVLPFAEYDARTKGVGSARIVDYQSGHVQVEVDTPRRGLLVLTDTNYPGWEATVDGRPAGIYQTDYLFRGVVVEPGVHRVTFDYRPVSVRNGMLISLGTLAFLSATLGLTLWRDGRSRPPPAV